MGKLTGASPEGRNKGASLANSLSPAQGTDVNSPSALLKSILKLDHSVLSNGMVLDMKFHPKFFESTQHKASFKTLVMTYFNNGGMELQFNVIKRETLIDVQNRPELYRYLVIRVSGFSAYFVTLDKHLQDEIITRTEYMNV